MTNVIPARAPIPFDLDRAVPCASSMCPSAPVNCAVRQLLGVWRCRTPTTGAGVVAAGEDPEKVGTAADLAGVAFVPVTIELSKVAVEGGADLLMPFTSSQPANTIS